MTYIYITFIDGEFVLTPSLERVDQDADTAQDT